jgi:hypothetical protein
LFRVVVILGAAGIVAPVAAAQVEPPLAVHIRIAPDNVSFYFVDSFPGDRTGLPRTKDLYARVERRVAAFVRTNRRWRDGDDHPVLTVTSPDRYQHSVSIAPGWSLIGDRRWPRTDWYDRFALRDQRSGRVYPIQPRLTAAERWRAAIERDSLTVSEYVLWSDTPPDLATYVSAWSVSPEAFWFACPSAGSGISALVRFDRATHRMRTISDGPVTSMEIDAFAQTRRTLWLAGHAGRGDNLSNSGVYRLDLATGTWTRFSAGAPDWPPGQVTALAASGDSVWVATTEGVGVFDDKRARGSVRYFAAHMTISDSVDDRDRRYVEVSDEYSLTSRPPGAEEARERLRIALVQRLAPLFAGGAEDTTGLRPDSTVAMVRAIPAAFLDSALADDDPLLRALAWPPLIARATRNWFSADSSIVYWDLDILWSIAKSPSARYAGLLRRLLARHGLDDASEHVVVRALAGLGDSSAGASLSRPTAELLAEPAPSAIQLRQIAGSATGAQWHSIVARLAKAGTLRSALFADVYTVSSAAFDSLVEHDSLTRNLAVDLAHRELAMPADTGHSGETAEAKTLRWKAAEVLLRARDRVAPAYLIPLMTKSADDFRLANSHLMELTAVDSAPHILHPNADERAQARHFWEQWWAAHEKTFTPVPLDAGKRALLRWRIEALRIQ